MEQDKGSSSASTDPTGKVTGIRQIVRLKGFLQKWQNVTLGHKRTNNNQPIRPRSPPRLTHAESSASASSPGGISPAISKRLLMSSNYYSGCESDEDGCASPEPPNGVPRGYLAVYVGPELRRFIIPTSYLCDPLFKKLLEKVEEEFGFDHSGALTIPCDTETFKYLLKCMENNRHKEHANDNAAGSSCAVEE